MDKKIPRLTSLIRKPKGSILKSSGGSMAIFLFFLIAVNYLASQSSWYIDLTQDKIYTASEASKEILGKLDKPVTVTFYISKDLPSDALIFKTQVQDVLNQYEDISKSKLIVKYETPDNENSTIQDLASKGIPQLQSEMVEKDKLEVKNYFFGAIISSGEGDSEKKEVLPSLGSLESFEYDLISAVYSVSKENKEIVALLTGHGEKELQTADLAKSYDIKTVNISADEGQKGFYIAPSGSGESDAAAKKEMVEPKTLVIAGPSSNLTEAEIGVLDDFVGKGGKVVVLSEKINIDVQQGFVTKETATNISDFTKKYGIEINKDMVYDKSNSPISYSKQTYFGAIQMTNDYPFWVKAVKDNFSGHPALAKVESLTFLWASSLKTENKDGYEVKSLISTTKSAESISENISLSPESNLAFLSPAQRTLAAISSAKDGGEVVVIGDSDFVSPGFMQGIPDNEIFFTNLIDSISSSANLSSIRAKNISDRPIRSVDEGERNYWKFVVICGGTILISVYGFMRIRKRRRLSSAA